MNKQTIIYLDQNYLSNIAWRFSRMWQKLSKIGINISDTVIAKNFLVSDLLLEIPYFDICCSINAAVNRYYPERKCKGSDIYDVGILATILPYCDIVTTDEFMKQILVDKLHFDNKYNTRIFSANKVDILNFQELIRTL
jgi:hypothetical protein